MMIRWRDDGDSLSLWLGRAAIARVTRFCDATAWRVSSGLMDSEIGGSGPDPSIAAALAAEVWGVDVPQMPSLPDPMVTLGEWHDKGDGLERTVAGLRGVVSLKVEEYCDVFGWYAYGPDGYPVGSSDDKATMAEVESDVRAYIARLIVGAATLD